MSDLADLFAPADPEEPPPDHRPPPGARCGQCAQYQRGTRSEWGACPPGGLRKDHHRACAWFAARLDAGARSRDGAPLTDDSDRIARLGPPPTPGAGDPPKIPCETGALEAEGHREPEA